MPKKFRPPGDYELLKVSTLKVNVSHMFTVSLFKTLTSLSNIEKLVCRAFKFINPTVCVFVYCAMYFWFYKIVYSV